MVPENADDQHDDDSSSEGGFTVSREDCDAMLREFESRLPEMPEDEKPQNVQDLLSMVESHDHRPKGYRPMGVIEVVIDEPAAAEAQGDTSDE